MKKKYIQATCLIICLFMSMSEICCAGSKINNENNSKQKVSNLSNEMMEIHRFDDKYKEIRNLFLSKNIYFEDVKDYFLNNGNIKLFDLRVESEFIGYMDEVSEKDYIRLKNNVKSICEENNNFDIGIGANFIGSVFEGNETGENILFWKGDYFGSKRHRMYLEYLIYGEDVADSISIQRIKEWNVIRKGISYKWHFSQSIEAGVREWGNDCLSFEENQISNEEDIDKELSYEKIKKVMLEHSDVFENYVKLLRQDEKKKFSYTNYMDFKREDDGQVYKNFNRAFLENMEHEDVVAESSQQEINLIPYCKETEKFIKFLKESNIVLPVGVSIETSFSEDETFQLKIFTRSKLVNDRCFNVTIAYQSVDKQIKANPMVQVNLPIWQTELMKPTPLERELIPHWYYIEEVGRWGGLYQGQ